MTINEEQADVILGLISFSDSESRLAELDAKLAIDLLEAFPKLNHNFGWLQKVAEGTIDYFRKKAEKK